MFAYKSTNFVLQFSGILFQYLSSRYSLDRENQGACDTIKHTLFTLTVVSRLTHVT